MLHQGVNSIRGPSFNHLLHAAELLLKIPEPLLLVEGDSALRSQAASWVLLRFPPPQVPTVVHAPWPGWTLLLFRHLKECRDRVTPHGEGGYGLPGSVVSPVDVVSVW